MLILRGVTCTVLKSKGGRGCMHASMFYFYCHWRAFYAIRCYLLFWGKLLLIWCRLINRNVCFNNLSKTNMNLCWRYCCTIRWYFRSTFFSNYIFLVKWHNDCHKSSNHFHLKELYWNIFDKSNNFSLSLDGSTIK